MSHFSAELSKIAAVLGVHSPALPRTTAHAHDLGMVGIDCLLVKGDNLEVLSEMLKSSPGCVDFSYIDPPYNTGQQFVYNDSRLGGQSPLWGEHTDWMAFMLPRLFLSRSLLKEGGVLAVSIDDYEYSRLKTILDVIFGESNHIATLTVARSKNGKGSKAGVSVNHEYVLLYGRSKQAVLHGLPEQQVEDYKKRDDRGWFKIDGLFRKKGDASRRSDRPNMFYPLYHDENGNVFTDNVGGRLKEVFPIDSSGVERRWLWGIEKAKSESWKLYASRTGVIYVKNYLTEEKRIKVKSLWDDVRYLTEKATNEVKHIFGEKIFETPKPLALLEDLIECCSPKDGLILDFFAGTGTTAHGAHLVNAKDGGSRKVILVEQNAQIPHGHIAREYGFTSVANIAEARLEYIRSEFLAYRFNSIEWSSESRVESRAQLSLLQNSAAYNVGLTP